MIRMAMLGGDVFTGKRPDTIVRREFGRRAFVRPRRDPNGLEWGQVLVPDVREPSCYHVMGSVLYVEEVDQ